THSVEYCSWRIFWFKTDVESARRQRLHLWNWISHCFHGAQRIFFCYHTGCSHSKRGCTHSDLQRDSDTKRAGDRRSRTSTGEELHDWHSSAKYGWPNGNL